MRVNDMSLTDHKICTMPHNSEDLLPLAQAVKLIQHTDRTLYMWARAGQRAEQRACGQHDDGDDDDQHHDERLRWSDLQVDGQESVESNRKESWQADLQEDLESRPSDEPCQEHQPNDCGLCMQEAWQLASTAGGSQAGSCSPRSADYTASAMPPIPCASGPIDEHAGEVSLPSPLSCPH